MKIRARKSQTEQYKNMFLKKTEAVAPGLQLISGKQLCTDPTLELQRQIIALRGQAAILLRTRTAATLAVFNISARNTKQKMMNYLYDPDTNLGTLSTWAARKLLIGIQ